MIFYCPSLTLLRQMYYDRKEVNGDISHFSNTIKRYDEPHKQIPFM